MRGVEIRSHVHYTEWSYKFTVLRVLSSFLGMDCCGHATANRIAAVGVEVKNSFDQLHN